MINKWCKANMCFDCQNAYANKCEYIHWGKPTAEQTAKVTKNGINILKCKNFVKDDITRIGKYDLFKFLGLKPYPNRNITFEELEELTLQKGYLLLTSGTEGKRFYIRKIPPLSKNYINFLLQQ